MSKRDREPFVWEEGSDLAEFCSEHLRNIDGASRADLRAFWVASNWIEGSLDLELKLPHLAKKIEELAYDLWLEDKDHQCADVDFIPVGCRRKSGSRPKNAKRYDGHQKFFLDELGKKTQTRAENRAAAKDTPVPISIEESVMNHYNSNAADYFTMTFQDFKALSGLKADEVFAAGIEGDSAFELGRKRMCRLMNLNAAEYDREAKKRKCSLLRREMGYNYDENDNEASSDQET